MKRKILSFVLVMCLIVPFAFILSACGANNNGGGMGQGSGSGGSNGGGESIPASSVLNDLEVITFSLFDAAEAILVKLPDGKNMLVDTGSEIADSREALLDELQAASINTIDFLVITNTNITRTGGGATVFESLRVKKLYRPNVACSHANAPVEAKYNSGAVGGYVETNVNYANLLAGAKTENCEVEIINKDSDISYKFSYNGTTYEYKIDFLTPTTAKTETSFTNASDYSAMISIEFEGKKVLIASDATATTEETFVANYQNLDIDVLVVARHGDAGSTTQIFLDVVKPEYAIISVWFGANNTNSWPNQVALNRLQAKNVTLYRTDYNAKITTKITTAGALTVTPRLAGTEYNYVGGDAE